MGSLSRIIAASTTRPRSSRRSVLFCTVLATGLVAAPLLAGATGSQHHGNSPGHGGHGSSGPVVSTDKGSVRGFVENGVYSFLGIPYAAPPVGNLRWRPPAPAKRWDGVRDATEFGNICPQVTELGAFAGPTSITEDCLYLNVFTTGTSHHGGKKPVIVWIHGGGNLDGATNGYDGSKLARGGPLGTPTVVVTINYRLGLFGFLSEQHLNSEGHPWGNYGILDSQAALRWVQRNIAAFGGDPNNVTLGGQSAGAIDTAANLISPASAGLFHRAITQSSPIPDAFFRGGRARLWPSATASRPPRVARTRRVCATFRPRASCSCRGRPTPTVPTSFPA